MARACYRPMENEFRRDTDTTANAKMNAPHPPLYHILRSAHVAQLAEHVLGKDEVTSSILVVGSIDFSSVLSPPGPGGKPPPKATSGSMNANDIRKGMVIIHEGNPCSVLEAQHRTPGNLRAFVQVRLRNLRSGNSFETRYSSTEVVERAIVERVEVEFLYNDGDTYHFMNTENYEQFPVTGESLGDAARYMADNIKVQLELYEGNPISVTLPTRIELEVVETEPEIRGATASSLNKPAKLSNGVTVQVPPFIKQGERIVINPNEDKYLERAK